MSTATDTANAKPRYELPMRMEDRRRVKLLTGHVAAPTLYATGWWLIESEPGTEEFLFSHDPRAREIIAKHNELWRAKHGDAAADEFQAAHERWCARVANANRRRAGVDHATDA